MPPITITADPIVLTAAPLANPKWGSVFYRRPELDITFNCGDDDFFGVEGKGVIKVILTPSGDYPNITIFPSAISLTFVPSGDDVVGVAAIADAIAIVLGFGPEIDVLTEASKRHWVKWSNIGSLDFTIQRDNVAGTRPLDWKGWVYEVKKLGNKVIAYGENGVSILTPSGVAWSLNTIYRLGLKGRQAVAGDETIHFFIDKEGKLWSISESLEKLDYSEYLSSLNNPVLSWDSKNRLLYICDNILGFIYSPDSRSLGKGPVNITGLGYQGGTLYIVAPFAISTPTFELWTDTYDLGSRKGKTIESIELGTDLTATLKAAARYRLDKASSFIQTEWVTVNSEGEAFIQCYGQEFQFGAKMDSYEYFELDYIKANGRLYELW